MHDYWIIQANKIIIPGVNKLNNVTNAMRAYKARVVTPKKNVFSNTLFDKCHLFSFSNTKIVVNFGILLIGLDSVIDDDSVKSNIYLSPFKDSLQYNYKI